MYKHKGVSEILVIVLIGIIGLSLLMWGMPTYNVWQQELSGKADLRKAEWTRQIAIEEAKALKESATLRAGAEVERAKGVAEANHIIADGLRNNEEYLRYLWIDSISNTENQIIYVPTEAGLPILEAGRR